MHVPLEPLMLVLLGNENFLVPAYPLVSGLQQDCSRNLGVNHPWHHPRSPVYKPISNWAPVLSFPISQIDQTFVILSPPLM